MTIDLVYLMPCDELEAYAPFVKRFCDTYYLFAAGHDHALHVCFTNSKTKTESMPLDKLMWTHEYLGTGRDIGAFQHMAHESDADMLVCCNTKVYFKREGWLRRFVEAWEQYGPGLYGASASREHCPLNPPNAPCTNPHIRTSCFAVPPAWLREYPIKINSREDGYLFESGPANFTVRQVQKHRIPRMVTWNKIVPYPFTEYVRNGYRDGDQSDLIAFDRATDEYDAAPPAAKQELQRLRGTLKA